MQHRGNAFGSPCTVSLQPLVRIYDDLAAAVFRYRWLKDVFFLVLGIVLNCLPEVYFLHLLFESHAPLEVHLLFLALVNLLSLPVCLLILLLSQLKFCDLGILCVGVLLDFLVVLFPVALNAAVDGKQDGDDQDNAYDREQVVQLNGENLCDLLVLKKYG